MMIETRTMGCQGFTNWQTWHLSGQINLVHYNYWRTMAICTLQLMKGDTLTERMEKTLVLLEKNMRDKYETGTETNEVNYKELAERLLMEVTK